jgi:hypothetical protein
MLLSTEREKGKKLDEVKEVWIACGMAEVDDAAGRGSAKGTER